MSTPRRLGSLLTVLLAAAALGVGCDKVPLLAPTQATITLVPSTTVVSATGSATIIASVIEQSGTPVQNGTVVTFTSSFGNVEPREARTTNGQATVEFRGTGQSGTAKIGAFSGGIRATELEILVGGAAADRIALRAEPSTVVTTGGTAQVTATVIDVSGNGLSGVPVTFVADNGSLVSSQVTTDASGNARTSITTNRTTKITASAGSKSAEVTITAVAAPQVTIALANTAGNPEAGGPTSFTVTPQSVTSGNPLANVVINWGDGQTTNLGAIAAATTVSHIFNSPGQYTVTATATDTSGNSTTTSTVINVTDRLTVPVTITVTPSNTPSLAAGGIVTFTASTTIGSGVSPVRFYEWDFGNGDSTVTTGQTVSYRYGATGNFTVRVRVVTTTGQEGFGQAQIRVTN